MFNPLPSIAKAVEEEINAEVKRRVEIEMVCFRSKYEQSMAEKERQIDKVLKHLTRIDIHSRPEENHLCYTTSIDDRMLMESLNDRDFLRDYLAKEIAYKLMAIQPVTRSRRHVL